MVGAFLNLTLQSYVLIISVSSFPINLFLLYNMFVIHFFIVWNPFKQFKLWLFSFLQPLRDSYLAHSLLSVVLKAVIN